MAFLLKFLILILTFHQVFGKSMYQKQQDKKRQEEKLVRAKAEASTFQTELNLYNFCKNEDKYYDEKCISLRDKESFRVYCETHNFESKCVKEFGYPAPWNWIYNISGLIFLLVVIISSFIMLDL
jgi:hypothetical protein